MAIALTPFTALCGFLPLDKIAAHLSHTPEFAALIPKAIIDKFVAISNSTDFTGPNEKAALKDLFSAVMTAEQTVFLEQLDKLVSRYTNGGATASEESLKDLVLTLYTQYPGDIGIFCAFLLNYVDLLPGQAIFLSAGEPHAYISGGTSTHLSS